MPRPPKSVSGTGRVGLGIAQGRRAEGRDRYARYAAQHDYPSSSAFGAPDYVDAAGRHYRIAYDPPTGDAWWLTGAPIPPRPIGAPVQRTAGGGSDRVRLWVQLPRKRHRFGARADADLWFDGARLATGGMRIELEPVAPGLAPVTIVVREAYRLAPTHRTGRIAATGIM
jgi:hypothetical protein